MRFRLRLAVISVFLVLAAGGLVSARAAARPLSADDITLLLVGGASPQKLISIINQRGIDFKLNPDLAKQFYQDGATDAVMDALQKASQKAKEAPQSNSSAQPSPPASQAGPQPVPNSSPQESVPTTTPNGSGPTPIPNAPAAAHPAAAPPPRLKAQMKAAPPPPSDAPLPDPSPDQVQHIIQTFAAKEQMFKEARDNYTYHQINKVETLDANNDVNGTWEQDWDILFNANGDRIEKVTYAPAGDLQGILVTQEDINAFRSIQPFVCTTEDLPDYNIRYLGHVHVDYLTTYVFSVRPKEIKKHHQYFDGTVWVDDRDFQIVKAEGRNVPQGKQRFPRFSTWRQQIDGKYWFPTFTMADDTLYFDGAAPVHIKEIVKYTDYHWFGARTKIISVGPVSPSNTPANPKH